MFLQYNYEQNKNERKKNKVLGRDNGDNFLDISNKKVNSVMQMMIFRS